MKVTIDEMLRYGPQLAVVFADKLNRSHLAVWENYLARCPYKVMLFSNARPTKPLTSQLPLFCMEDGYRIGHLGKLPTLRGLLYLGNYAANWRFFYQFPRSSNVNNDIRHVFLGHGDSDKESSHSRVSMIYDYVAVADQAARERYRANGVLIHNRRFLYTGVPVFPGLEVVDVPRPMRRLLYAPTFEAKRADSNFSSLAKVAAQLAPQSTAAGVELLLRAHPSTGIRLPEYLDAKKALLQELPEPPVKAKADQFNWSDAIITDISGVMSEYLFTGKPIIVPVEKGDKLTLRALSGSTDYSHVYRWNYRKQTLGDLLQSIGHDPLFATRQSTRNQKYLDARTFDESLANFSKAMGRIVERRPDSPF